MDTIELIGATMGLGFLAGVRLYATILTLGLAIRFGWFHPGPMAEPLRILAEPMVLIAAGVACAIEFFADKVAWVDSIWDSFHAFIRPIGAVVVSAAVLGSFDPVLKVTLIILCGGRSPVIVPRPRRGCWSITARNRSRTSPSAWQKMRWFPLASGFRCVTRGSCWGWC